MKSDALTPVNPLECGVCQREFNNPVHLPCLHVFCAGCIRPKPEDEASPLCCPECNKPVGETPPTDLLAKFLVDTAHETAEVCANCDKVYQPMFFCETCQQALCLNCRKNTHQAKMFSAHKLVSLEERARVRGRVSCADHGEPYILFCVDEKRLVCIQCFNGRPLEARHSFVSIDAAHAANLEKLEKWTNKLRLFQMEKREELEVRKRMLNEIEERSIKQESMITQLCQDIVDTVHFVRDRALEDLATARKDAERECASQIADLDAVMAPARLHLLSAQILCASASKIDFLQFQYDLIKRIQSLLMKSIERPPAVEWKDIDTLRSDLAKALEPHVGLSAAFVPSRDAREGSGSASYKGSRCGITPGSFVKYQMMVDLAGAFGEHFAHIELPMKDITSELAELSAHVQETQRDITRRKVLLREENIEKLISECATANSRVGMHAAKISELQPELQELWQEALDRVRRQQIIYREKLDECSRLRETASHLLVAARQLAQFARSLEQMTATIDPKRRHPPDPAPMESICQQILTIAPDSERRCQAIEEEENNRRILKEAERRNEELRISGVGRRLHRTKLSKKKSKTSVTISEDCRDRTATELLQIKGLELEMPSDDVSCSSLGDICSSPGDIPSSIAEDRSETEFPDVEKEDDEEIEDTVQNVVCSSKTELASRISNDIDGSRENVLQCLNDVFSAHQDDDTLVSERPNVLASTVRQAEREILVRCVPNKTPQSSSTSKQRQNAPSQDLTNAIPKAVAAACVDSGMREAHERLLESIRQRVPRLDQTPEPEP